MNTPTDQCHEEEVRQRIIALLRLAARDIVKHARAEQKNDSACDHRHDGFEKKQSISMPNIPD
jgi:hypothetical protein